MYIKQTNQYNLGDLSRFYTFFINVFLMIHRDVYLPIN